MVSGRALHYVFKVADRTLTSKFYREILGMKVLRHEEFTEGCDAQCNGPYDNRWSKTMIGYGPEDTHFVLELTYNYGINSYELGNDFRGITIRSKQAIDKAKEVGWPLKNEDGQVVLEAPGGYKFFLIDDLQPIDKDPIEKVSLNISNLQRSLDYWNKLLGLKIYEKSEKSVLLGFSNNQTKLELYDIGQKVNRAKAFGRIAFSIPFDEQPKLSEKVETAKEKILTPLISLDTPGKATDGHEICFVDDENFRKLSAFDPEGEALLDRYIKKDLARFE
uniref:VOC domain-containing protein n=2 Tax=Timema TaxID=61471 RepID=A0A7R9B050_TIMSH|nr:unnamed protein product [Timema shepardi]